MWFEVLPSYMIVTIGMSVPTFAIWGLNKLVFGNVSDWGSLVSTWLYNVKNGHMC